MDTLDYQSKITDFRATLFEFLFQRSVCLRCIFRVNLEQSFSLYRESAAFPEIIRAVDSHLGSDMMAQYSSSALKKEDGIALCQVCLGII